jgi:hypothetical protein
MSPVRYEKGFLSQMTAFFIINRPEKIRIFPSGSSVNMLYALIFSPFVLQFLSISCVAQMADMVRAQMKSYGIYGEQSGTVGRFSTRSLLPLPSIPPKVSESSTIQGRYNRPNSDRYMKWTVSPHQQQMRK